MTVQQMIDLLAMRLEDPAKKRFTDKFKHRTLETAQMLVANLVDDGYLTDLETEDTNETVTSGVMNLSGLTYNVLRGTEGILNVKNYSGLYCSLLNWDDLKKTENTFLTGSTRNPMAWLFAQAVRTLPTSLSSIDVKYLKVPDPLLYPFVTDYTGASPGGTGTEFKCDDGATYGFSTTDDYYNNAPIYMKDYTAYHLITDYTGSSYTFTISPSSDTNFDGDETFYFVPANHHDFHLTYMEGVTCDLDAQLHNAVVYFAEAECWAMANELNRATSALEKAIQDISDLNSTVKQIDGIGISR